MANNHLSTIPPRNKSYKLRQALASELRRGARSSVLHRGPRRIRRKIALVLRVGRVILDS